jgi:hypothetical protein
MQVKRGCVLLVLAACQFQSEGGSGRSTMVDGKPDELLGDGGVATADGGLPDLCDHSPPPGPARALPPASDPRSAKEIYDQFFVQYLPEHDQFGWEAAPWLTADWVESLHFPTPPAGLESGVLHGLFDFNPFNFERGGVDALLREGDNQALFAATSDPLERLRRHDPTEWMPAVASTYARSPFSDIMAVQFWFRASSEEYRPALERALELCPDCDDVFTPLSANDLGKIIEVRLVRLTSGAPELSRVFKLIGVDSSGSIGPHTQNDSWNRFGTIDGVEVTAKWRLELSGALAQRYWQSETEYIRLMPVLIRASRPAALFQYYDGRFDREAETSDDPYARSYNPDAEGECLADCHAALCQAGRDVSGYYYFQRSSCTCGLNATPLATPLSSDLYTTGACEEWPAGVWATSPSSSACGD